MVTVNAHEGKFDVGQVFVMVGRPEQSPIDQEFNGAAARGISRHICGDTDACISNVG
jgi:hypothetical protein